MSLFVPISQTVRRCACRSILIHATTGKVTKLLAFSQERSLQINAGKHYSLFTNRSNYERSKRGIINLTVPDKVRLWLSEATL